MLDPKELESIYDLLHSNDENNVNLALTIIENREEVKRVFEQALSFHVSSRRDNLIDFLISEGYKDVNFSLADIKEWVNIYFYASNKIINFKDIEFELVMKSYNILYTKNKLKHDNRSRTWNKRITF
mgnify:CR=1 FL=1